MKNFALTLTILSVLSIASSARGINPLYQANNGSLTPEEQEMDFVIQGARGFMLGFQQGLYKITKVDESCLNADAEAKILDLFSQVFEGKFDVSKLFALFTDIMSISNSVQSCNVKAVSDLANWCLFDQGNNCTPAKIMDNFQKNLLIIMGKMTDISTLVMQGLPKNAEESFNVGQQAGNDIGSLIRVCLGFVPSQ